MWRTDTTQVTSLQGTVLRWCLGQGQWPSSIRLEVSNSIQGGMYFHEPITDSNWESVTNPFLPYFIWCCTHPPLLCMGVQLPWTLPCTSILALQQPLQVSPFFHLSLHKLLPTYYFRLYIATWLGKQKRQVWGWFPSLPSLFGFLELLHPKHL